MKVTQKARAFSVGMLLALAVLTVSVAARPAGAADLFNNWNTGGVANNPTNPTVFTLTAAAHITELATYHWNNGQGATPGTISLRSQTGQVFGPFQARGASGQAGAPNVNWVADINVTVPAGTYTVLDSNPNTWSHNPQSQSRGFAAVRGSPAPGAVAVPPPGPAAHPPQPQPAPSPQTATSAVPNRCHFATYVTAWIGPCTVKPGQTIYVQLMRAVGPPFMLLFKAASLTRGVATPAAVTLPLAPGGSLYSAAAPRSLCLVGTGGHWDVFLLAGANRQGQGQIANLMMDCR